MAIDHGWDGIIPEMHLFDLRFAVCGVVRITLHADRVARLTLYSRQIIDLPLE